MLLSVRRSVGCFDEVLGDDVARERHFLRREVLLGVGR